jgi:hypothetical protein
MTPTETTADTTKNSIALLRQYAADNHADLEQLADHLEAGCADKTEIHRQLRGLTHTLVAIEDAAADAGVIDAETPPFRAVDQARKVIYYVSVGSDTDAIVAAHTAAEYAEILARND